MKKKLKGYTKTKGGYALVFQNGKKLEKGKTHSTKSSLISAAKKYLKR